MAHRSRDAAGSLHTAPMRRLLGACAVLLLTLAGCGDGTGAGETTGQTAEPDSEAGTETSQDGASPAEEEEATESESGEGTGGGGTGTETENGQQDPVGDLELVLDGCDYIPGGALGGGDVLNVYVFVLLIGTNELDDRPRLVAESDTGLRFDRQVQPSNQAVTAMQFTVDDSHLGRTHTFAIMVDPDDQVPETDEGNNELSVALTLPDQPQAQVPLDCG